jgi:hypothetical protein
MTTAMDFLEPRICRRRCEDHLNDLENHPLLEATSSTVEQGEHKQESNKVHPSTPHPKPLMLALFFVLLIETMAIKLAIQIRPQGQEYLSLFLLLGGVIGPIVDTIVVGVNLVVLAIYFRFMHDAVKDKAFFGISWTTSIVLRLAIEALGLLVELNHSFATSLAIMHSEGFLLAFLVGYLFESLS